MLKKLILAAAALAFAAPVLADNDHRGHGRGHFKHHHKHHHHFHHYHRPVVVTPRVYYAPPAPVYYAPPPVVYRPAPVYAAPVPPSMVSIRLHFPL